IDLALVKRWIATCERGHGTCRRIEAEMPTGVHLSSAQPLEILLVDVQNLCLVKATTRSRYLALSYVWGNVQQLMATKSATDLFQPQGLIPRLKEIPRTILDAFQFAGKISERYVWVDSLCIIQDDEELKHHQISRMGEIYSGATATIIAATGEDADSRLPGLQRGTRTGMSSYRFHEVFSQPMLCRPLNPGHPLRSLAETKYSTRGWT
ncbi:HET-domain-containing protein, partial [Lophiostoma macrostomum CBS 122681]